MQNKNKVGTMTMKGSKVGWWPGAVTCRLLEHIPLGTNQKDSQLGYCLKYLTNQKRLRVDEQKRGQLSNRKSKSLAQFAVLSQTEVCSLLIEGKTKSPCRRILQNHQENMVLGFAQLPQRNLGILIWRALHREWKTSRYFEGCQIQGPSKG
jgi:hypothetical protein